MTEEDQRRAAGGGEDDGARLADQPGGRWQRDLGGD